jgi:hypothetical protein
VTPRQKDERLLWDCATVARFLDSDRSPAHTRVNTELGEQLALFLLTTLQDNAATLAHKHAHGQPSTS